MHTQLVKCSKNLAGRNSQKPSESIRNKRQKLETIAKQLARQEWTSKPEVKKQIFQSVRTTSQFCLCSVAVFYVLFGGSIFCCCDPPNVK